jgi:hypothetical protein
MTPDEWETATDPPEMVEAVRGLTSDRKLRLFAVGYCRQLGGLISDPRSRRAVDVAERFADDSATAAELVTAWEEVFDTDQTAADWAVLYAAGQQLLRSGRVLGSMAWEGAWALSSHASDMQSELVAAGITSSDVTRLARCVFGNPFRPGAFDPRWRTADVLGLALGIYEDRAFDRLPLLADALMDAGCTDAEVLGHCRSEGHVRGCWLIDLVLGKG